MARRRRREQVLGGVEVLLGDVLNVISLLVTLTAELLEPRQLIVLPDPIACWLRFHIHTAIRIDVASTWIEVIEDAHELVSDHELGARTFFFVRSLGGILCPIGCLCSVVGTWLVGFSAGAAGILGSWCGVVRVR